MKTLLLKSFVLVALITFTSCGDKAKEAETTKAAEAAKAEATAVNYKVDTENSTIEWKGFKPTGEHFGTIAIQEGKLQATDGELAAGKFVIDMNSIEVLDIPADDESHAKLTGHLKSADFFEVEKFSTSNFEMTGISTKDGQTMLSGNLTLKDATNNVTFPVKVDNNGETITLTSETFTIDRSKWNVKYGSKSFFSDLGDKFINDDIELKVVVKATKA